jgi:hypothetical protein
MIRNEKKEICLRDVEILLVEIDDQPLSFLMIAIDANGDITSRLLKNNSPSVVFS